MHTHYYLGSEEEGEDIVSKLPKANTFGPSGGWEVMNSERIRETGSSMRNTICGFI
jgi:hypothetical protein